jgi:prevent-host-death family protein
MLEVDIEKIIPVTDARDSLNQIIETVDGTDALYVITKNGKPSAIIVGVHHLEKLTGMKSDELTVDEETAEPAPTTSEAFSKADAATGQTTTEEPYKPTQIAPAPFTLTPEEDDIFAPLPEPEAPIVPAPAPIAEPPVDLSQAPAPVSATPTMPAAPATPPAQAPTDQV